MKAYAALEGTREISEITLPTPTPTGAEVLLRALHAGERHSDTHLLEDRYDTCRTGHDDACADGRMLGVQRHGGYAEYVCVPHDRNLIDISGLDPAWAAMLACSGLTTYGAINKVRRLDPVG